MGVRRKRPFFAGHSPASLKDFTRWSSQTVAGGRNVGTWRRTITGKRLTIETDLAPGLDEEHLAAIRSAVDDLTVFLGHSPQR